MCTDPHPKFDDFPFDFLVSWDRLLSSRCNSHDSKVDINHLSYHETWNIER